MNDSIKQFIDGFTLGAGLGLGILALGYAVAFVSSFIEKKLDS